MNKKTAEENNFWGFIHICSIANGLTLSRSLLSFVAYHIRVGYVTDERNLTSLQAENQEESERQSD